MPRRRARALAPLALAALSVVAPAPAGARDGADLRAGGAQPGVPRFQDATPGGPRFQDAQPAGPSVEERLEEIRRRLAAVLEYPPIARRLELEGTAWLRFEVDRAGVAHAVELARSSGHDVLDRAALRTVGRAGPLPWVYGRIEVPVRFALDDPPP
ncbi:MAG: energy transducer TonB [Deltaproteobacteria bacterium]|nr:energy transducer TonB [Deltaproteobacteria bacterium]